jgi:hypothetical protein
MAISLLKLDTGHYSLEFEPADIERVSEALRETCGSPAVRRGPIATSYSFDGVELTYQNQWDDPCLIASNEAGDAILKKLEKWLRQISA